MSEEAESQENENAASEENAAESQTEGQERSVNEDSSNPGKETSPAEQKAAERPEWLTAKYWKPDEMVKDGELDYQVIAEQQAQARQAAEQRLFTRKDELKAEVLEEMKSGAEIIEGVPNDPESYTVNIHRELAQAEGYEVGFDEDDPMLSAFKDLAHRHNVTQDEFDDIINMYVKTRMDELPDFNDEMHKLGDHAEQRIDRAHKWAKHNLSSDNFKTVAALASNAAFVTALEEIMELAGQPSFQISEDTGQIKETLTKDDLKAMMDDPKYWKEQDPAFIARVRAGFARLGG